MTVTRAPTAAEIAAAYDSAATVPRPTYYDEHVAMPIEQQREAIVLFGYDPRDLPRRPSLQEMETEARSRRAAAAGLPATREQVEQFSADALRAMQEAHPDFDPWTMPERRDSNAQHKAFEEREARKRANLMARVLGQPEPHLGLSWTNPDVPPPKEAPPRPTFKGPLPQRWPDFQRLSPEQQTLAIEAGCDPQSLHVRWISSPDVREGRSR